MIKILIVDDSETEAKLLKRIFESDRRLKVIGCAKNGKEAFKLVPILNPDIITMDIEMPVMNGLEATRLIMSKYPTPIVVISSKLDDDTLQPTFRALESGALMVIDKPYNILSPDFDQIAKHLIDTIRSMAEIKCITRHIFHHKIQEKVNIVPVEVERQTPFSLIAIGSSIGGPQAMKSIFSQLPKEFPVPIVVVQHMTPGFIGGLAKWINEEIDLKAKLAENYESLKSGTIYFAPDGYHLTIKMIEKNSLPF